MSYIPYNGSSVLPDWVSRPVGVPRVCVTLGTVLPRYGQMESLLERILSVIGEIGAEAVVGVSSADVAAMRDRGRLPAEIKDMPLTCKTAYRIMTAAASPYRGIRATMEQPSVCKGLDHYGRGCLGPSRGKL
jgi:hypothetical protein